ncbi:MAG: secretin N-terminal domain-containing protein [Phycisphaerales bacterium JB063]
MGGLKPLGTAVCLGAAFLAFDGRPAFAQNDPFRPGGNQGGGGGRGQDVITSVEFVDTPVTSIFRMISDMTGWSIVASEQVSANPPNIDLWIKNMPPERALEEVARLAGLVVERNGNTVHVMTYEDYSRIYGVEQRVVSVEHAEAARLVPVLQQFVDGEQAKIVADAESNQLVLLVGEPMIDRLVELIATLDVPFEQDVLRAVRLDYLEATEIVSTLQQFLNTSAQGSPNTGTRRPGEAAPAAEGNDGVVRAGSSWGVQFMVEPTLNTILVRGREADVVRTLELIENLDVDPGVSVVSYGMSHTNAADAYDTLQAIIETDRQSDASALTRRLKVGVSEQNNRIVVQGTEADHRYVEALIREIDKPLPAGTGGVRVYRLENTSAAEVAAVLNGLIESADDLEGRSGNRGRSRSGRNSPSNSAGRRLIREDGGSASNPGSELGPGGALGGASGEAGEGTGDLFQARITEATDINAVVIRATASEHAEFEALIRELDAPRDQVLLEVTLVSVRSTDSFNLGLELAGAAVNGSGTDLIGLTSFGIGAVNSATGDISLTSPPPTGLNFAIFDTSDFSVVLNALETVGDTRIQSSPSVLVQDNAQALIRQVSQEPVERVSQGDNTTVTGFEEFVDAGTDMLVIPHIGPRDTLRIEYSIQLSSFGERTAGQATSNLPPPRFENAIQGTARVPSDYTIVLGGLVNRREGMSEDSVPLLSDIPVVGELFKSREAGNTSETLFVFIRPIIMRDPTFADLIQLSEREIRKARLARDEQLFNDLLPITPTTLDAAAPPLPAPGDAE